METHGAFFIRSNDILGFSIGPSTETMLNDEKLLGSAIQVFLPIDGFVQINRKDRLIYQLHFPAGKHFVDSAGLPAGASDIEVRVTDDSGEVVDSFTQFYSKFFKLPPLGEAHQYASVGVLRRKLSSGGKVLPTFSRVPIIELTDRRSLQAHFGLESSLAASPKRAFLTESVFYFGERYVIEPSILVGTDPDIGLAISGHVNFGKQFVISANARRIWSKNSHLTDSDVNDRDKVIFDPISGDTESAGLTARYRWKKANVSAGLSINRSGESQRTTRGNINFTRQLFTI
jgi:hypothetical protein